MDVRRVVTGHDADGRAVFVSDTAVAPCGSSSWARAKAIRFTDALARS